MGGDDRGEAKRCKRELAHAHEQTKRCHQISEERRARLARARSSAAHCRGALRVETRFRKDLSRELRGVLGTSGLAVRDRDGRLVLRLPAAVLFRTAQSTLSKGGALTIEKMAPILARLRSRRFLVAGHTDTTPVRRGAKFRHNWELSALRAIAVVQALVRHGVAATQLAAAGYGQHSPIAANDSAAGRQNNRRIEIILMPRTTAPSERGVMR